MRLMPNISSHMSVAKRVGELLNINDDNFIIGNLLPDLEEDKVKSHYKIRGKFYLIPNIDYIVNHLELDNPLNIGIFTHLLLDKYYLEEYLYEKVPNVDVFKNKLIYRDYDILNKDIVNYFDLDIDYLKNTLSKIKNEKYKNKLINNIDYLSLNKSGETTYLNKDEFIKFLSDISIKISEDLKNIIILKDYKEKDIKE